MAYIGSLIEFLKCICGCFRTHTSYVRNLEENLGILRVAMEELKDLRDEVKGRVELAEAQLMMRTPLVGGWLRKVEIIKCEVEEMLQQNSTQIEDRCLRGYWLKNCWTSYKFGKAVDDMLSTLDELKTNCKFNEVANRSRLVSVQAMPKEPTVGMELLSEKAMKFLQDDKVKIMGLYGMGGVGKTTLLKKISNSFKELNLGRIQKEIGKRLGLSWEGDKVLLEARAKTIFNILSHKKFLLLLDDCWERVD